jgi:hypothetical protein
MPATGNLQVAGGKVAKRKPQATSKSGKRNKQEEEAAEVSDGVSFMNSLSNATVLLMCLELGQAD